MARREFNLPGIQDLSKEQEDARALPKEGQHLIIGGPGTGKSVLALLRSRRHQQDKDAYVFLVFNKLLNQSSCQLFGNDLSSQQWQSWLMETFRAETGLALPRHPKDKNNWREIDWIQASAIVAKGALRDEAKRPLLIIDEGQDMPPDFYQVLSNLGFENFYVVADQNQQIVSGENSTREDIQNSLGIGMDDVIELKNNYRNTYPIARLAREFYTGNPASPPPELPNRPSAIRPFLYEYMAENFQKIIDRILKTADTNPNKLYGIITPNNNVRDRYYQALMATNIVLDNRPPHIETYSSNAGDKPDLSFNEGGIMVINAQSCKGLEFDTVFLADINQYRFNPTHSEQSKRLFYVMVARAKEQVIMLKKAGTFCAVETILPTDTEIMERK